MIHPDSTWDVRWPLHALEALAGIRGRRTRQACAVAIQGRLSIWCRESWIVPNGTRRCIGASQGATSKLRLYPDCL
jgi:hypothetical protein